MGMQEKEREEGYWKVFSTTGSMPIVPMEFAEDDKVEYVLGVIRSQYNPLTKILFAEALARAEKLPDDVDNQISEAVGWISPMIFSKKREYLSLSCLIITAPFFSAQLNMCLSVSAITTALCASERPFIISSKLSIKSFK